MRLYVLLLLLCSASAINAEVRISITPEPEGRVVVGQQLRLNVLIETDTWFTTAPKYPEMKLDGAIVLMPDAFGVNSTRREGPTTWAGQTRRFVVFAQRAGMLEIPPVVVQLAVAVDGRPGAMQSVQTPAISIDVTLPAGAGTREFVTTPDYRLKAEWDQPLEGLVVGDAITLEVTQRASEVFALSIPPVNFPEMNGLARYGTTPELDDRNNRGRYSATRTDIATYVLQSEGEFAFPAVETLWFNLSRQELVEEQAGEAAFTVAANPDAIVSESPGKQAADGIFEQALLADVLNWLRDNLQQLTVFLGALYLAMLLLRRLTSELREAWRKRRAEIAARPPPIPFERLNP